MENNYFEPIDPLKAKQVADTEVAVNALKREITNILTSYVGWFDPFCELIQNSLDSLEEKINNSPISSSYKPIISIIIDIQQNRLTVSDNGIGLTKPKFEQFLAPCFSFKTEGQARGHKGVGATYLAYGFNFMQICTRTEDFAAIGKMIGARDWLSDKSPAANPTIIPDSKGAIDIIFNNFETGVSITVGFDKSTNPKELSWIDASSAKQWRDILLIKTGLGSFFKCEKINVELTVISKNGEKTCEKIFEPEYLWPHLIPRVSKSFELANLDIEIEKLFSVRGINPNIPSKMKNIEGIYHNFDATNIESRLKLSLDDIELFQKHNVKIYFFYSYTAKLWTWYNEDLELRKGYRVLQPGIQICANRMPQGEIIQVPLNRNIGRQNQIHVVIHFDNCSADMGRKGFQNQIVEFSKRVSASIIDSVISSKYSNFFKPVTGVNPNLKRQLAVSQWKKEFEKHEEESPLSLINKNFFNPVNEISISSIPTREQDVIALFNQLLAGGVIRGLKIMSTNERFTYDGMFKIEVKKPDENHLYDCEKNPLGISSEYLESYLDEAESWISEPKILEYKFSLDGLIENIESGTKNSNDIDLVIVWDIGKDYQQQYNIVSFLNDENRKERNYHGLTHRLIHPTSGQPEMDVICLKDLILYLNDRENTIQEQIKLYG